MLANIKYMIVQFTNYNEQFGKIDAVANICSQIAVEHKLEYGHDFGIAELGIAEDGYQWVKVEFKEEETAMIVRLRGLKTVSGGII